MLLDHNFGFLGCYLVVTARYLVVTAGYCSLPGDYWLLLVPAFSMKVYLICLSEYYVNNKTNLFGLSFVLLILKCRNWVIKTE